MKTVYIVNLLTDYIESENLLSKTQAGFKSGYSTLDCYSIQFNSLFVKHKIHSISDNMTI